MYIVQRRSDNFFWARTYYGVHKWVEHQNNARPFKTRGAATQSINAGGICNDRSPGQRWGGRFNKKKFNEMFRVIQVEFNPIRNFDPCPTCGHHA